MKSLKWWQTAVFYQIYPRSFADGNGDGIGDLQGIIEHLDYLQALGIDAIWLSPHYPSPQFDCGYDIADYTGVEPEYGTLEEFKAFLDGAHQRGIRVILDLVLNHTSDQHPWFIESRSSRDNPKRDWYIWHDGRDGGPPNNWHSLFDDSAWAYDETTGQYYYHFFFKEQPDLNWRNPEVKKAMFDAVRFWLDLGVDGYRLDALGALLEDPALPDHTAAMSQREITRAFLNPAENSDPERMVYLAKQYQIMVENQENQPGVHEIMQELRAIIDEYDGDRFLVGETDDVRYHGNGDNELHMVFNFPLMRTARLTPAWIRANQQERHAILPPGAWPCMTLGNHDSSRLYSRYGDNVNNDALARLHLALVLTLPGTAFLYNGEEIGMSDWLMTEMTEFRDNLGLWQYGVATAEFGDSAEAALDVANRFSRDKGRTPMQWANEPNAGFSPPGVRTWLPVNPNYADGVNVADQEDDPDSMLNFYKRMLRLRRETPALIAGDYRPLDESDDYLAFLRQTEEQRCLVVLNFSNQSHTVQLDVAGKAGETVRPLFSSHQRGESGRDDPNQLSISPFEIYIGELA